MITVHPTEGNHATHQDPARNDGGGFSWVGWRLLSHRQVEPLPSHGGGEIAGGRKMRGMRQSAATASALHLLIALAMPGVLDASASAGPEAPRVVLSHCRS